MPDIRKLIVAFLIFAALASTSSLVLLNNFQNNAVPVPSAAEAAAPAPAQSTAIISGNVFVPTPKVAEEVGWQGSSTATSSDTTNLTDTFTNSFLNNLIAANPSGPQDNGGGNQTIVPPNEQNILTDLGSSSAYKDITVPDWDLQAEEIPVIVATSSSQADLKAYGDALNTITNADFVKTNLQGIVGASGNGTPDNLAYVSTQMNDALNQVAALPVPASLLDFHKNLITMLVYGKNALALAASSTADPMKTSYILESENARYLAAMQSFKDSLEKASASGALSFALPPGDGSNKAFAFLENIFGIPTAHAQYIVFDPTTFAQMLWQWAQGVILQLLKNEIILKLQNKVLNFVNNSGNPLIVQSWSALVGNAFTGASDVALGQVQSSLCPSFGGDVTSWLKNLYPTSNFTGGGLSLNGGAGPQCTLNNYVPNVQNFYNDFNAGGWNGLFAAMSPQGNPLGALLESETEVQSVSNPAATAAKNNGIAANGYQGQTVCDDGSSPIMPDLCLDGTEPITKTPGHSLADAVGHNLTSMVGLVTNANDITGLLATIAIDMLNKMVTSSGLF